MKSKIFTLLTLLFCLPMITWAQIGGYDPDNPDDPGSPHLKHTLTLNASPDNSCYLDHPTSRVAEGSTFYLYASPRNGFRFVAWVLSSGDTLSLLQEYLFTMPDSDLSITALFVYDPTNPPDPSVIQRSKQLTLSASPANGGYFNFRNGRVPINDIVTLYAYPNRDYEFVYWSINDTVLSNSPEMDYTMPNRDVQIVAHYRYNPANPGNPGANSANPNGDIVMDDFTPGQLMSAIANVLEQSNMTYNDVRRITVSGSMRNYDFGIAAYFPHCHYIDLSQVSGITTIPAWAFEASAIDTIFLPSSINNISNYAFANCNDLSVIYCYAVMPPSVENTSFDSVPHSTVHVYVPASALALYQAHPVWSTFQLHSMLESVSNLTVSIPHTIPIAEMEGMKLVLTNLTTHQKQYLVLTSSRQYGFFNLQNNSSWKITIENQRNDIFGSIDSVHVSHNDTTITMNNILLPKNVSLSIVADGVDVTSQVQVTWYTQDNLFLHRGSTLQQIRQGSDVSYQVSLPKSLTFEYLSVPATPYHVGTTDNNVSLALTHRDTVRISGFVKDSTTREMISNASVNIVQTFEGRYLRSTLLKTDSRGFYTATLYKVPTTIECNAENHYGKTIEFDSSMWSSGSSTVLPMVELKNYVSGFVSLHLSYQLACEEDSMPTIQPFFSDYRNVRYSLFNRTQNRPVEDVSVNYPMLKMRDEANSGDTIDLRAISTTDAFYPVDTFLVLDSTMHGSAFINILEKGKIVATYGTSPNDHSVALLFNSEGFLITRQVYSSDQVEFDNLNNGIYTVVSMADHDIFSHIASLQNLVRIGLVEYSDYLSNTIQVSNGRISTIYNDSIPHLSDSNTTILSTNSSFTSDECDVAIGELVTLRANIELKPLVDGFVSNPTLIIDLPQNCSFVGNSVIINNRTSQCSIEGNQLVIPLTSVNSLTKVRLCVQATSSGNLIQTAYLRYSRNDAVSLDPIGTTNISVVDFHISVPEYVATPNIPVTGTAEPRAIVSIFDADEMIGQTQANADGEWEVHCLLENPEEYSEHLIQAKAIDERSNVKTSSTKSCIYNPFSIQVSKVKMLNNNTSILFDFLNKSNVSRTYSYSSSCKTFTFTIDFTENNPEKIANVVLWVKLSSGSWYPLDATYDSLHHNWLAVGNFSNSASLPINVSVDFGCLTETIIGRTAIDNANEVLSEVTTDLRSGASIIEQGIDYIFSLIEDSTISEQVVAAVIDSTCLSWGIDASNPGYVPQTSFQSIEDSLDALYLMANSGSLSNFDSLVTMPIPDLLAYQGLLQFISIGDCSGLDTSILEAQGYSKVMTSDLSYVYILQNDSIFQFVDFARNQSISIDLLAADSISNIEGFQQNGLISSELLLSKNPLSSIRAAIVSLNEKYIVAQNVISNILGAIESFKNVSKFFAIKASSSLGGLLKDINILRNADRTPYGDEELARSKAKVKSIVLKRYGANKFEKFVDNSKTIKVLGLLGNISSMIDDLNQIINIYQSLPTECDGLDSDIIDALKTDLITLGIESSTYYVLNIGLNIYSLSAASASALALIPTAGLSWPALAASIGAFLINYASGEAYKWGYSERLEIIKNGIYDFDCSPTTIRQENPHRPENPNGGKYHPTTPDLRPSIDPSGYVYEGVPSNRLEGVTATCFFKEYEEMPNGDIEEHEMLWDASEFDQENPLYTDENGLYQWFVPQGLWKVVFEKMGYETAQTDWLPVPPPQLEVNVGMVQNSHPEVKMAHAYPDAVELEFDKFMLPLLLNTNNISITQNGVPVAGSIVFLNEESADTLNAPSFVSKIRFNADSAFTASQITLHVSSRVKSYANVNMQSDYVQTFAIEPEITAILCDSVVNVNYGHDQFVNVSVLPATAAVGKTLRINSVSPDILSVSTDSVLLDASGQASFTVHGSLPGMTSLNYTIDGFDRTASSIVTIDRNACIPSYTLIDTTVCGFFAVDDTIYNSSCIIRNTYPSASGCDSVVTINLTVNDASMSVDHIVTCDSAEWHGVTYFASNNTATFITQNIYGCDSIIALDLIIKPNYTITFHGNGGVGEMPSETLCSDVISLLPLNLFARDGYFFAGWSLTNNGTVCYTDGDTISLRGDMNLYAVWSTSCVTSYNTTLETGCDSIYWRNTSYFASGSYYDTVIGVVLGGCDSVYVLHLTINHSNAATDVQIACDSLMWHGTTYSVSTIVPTFVSTNAAGCDSTTTLHLTINHSNAAIDAQVACDSLIWHGTTYSVPTTDPTFISTNAVGCDSTTTLHLTINHSTAAIDAQTACDSLIWHGVTYTTSTDTPTFIGTNAVGCDSTTTLRLTIHYSWYDTIRVDTTGSYDWNGITYTESGVYPWILQTEEGCDSIVTLILTLQSVGINSAILQNEYKIYPNPTYGIVTIEAEKVLTIDVYDMMGRIVLCNNDRNSIDLTDLPSGIYSLRIMLPNESYIKRIVKK